MKFNFMIAGALLLAGAACRPAPPAAGPGATDGSDVQRLVAILDYIAGDYDGAVQDGKVANPDEYAEQHRFVADARTLTLSLLRTREGLNDATADPLAAGVDAVAGLVERKAAPEEVVASCRALKTAVIDRFGLRTAPNERPSRERARALFVQDCAVCHGARGDADTERARTLKPAPVNFRAADVRPKLSPHRVYNTLTFGVSGTAMPAWDSIPPEDRWSLAFYVLSLAHEGAAEGEGVPAAMTLADLASQTDEEIVAELRAQGHPSPQRGLTHLRTVAPYEEPKVTTGVAETRALLRRALAAYTAGRASDADRLLLDAYLQGFEPLEPHLRARDPQMTSAFEKDFQSLRAAVGRGRPKAEVKAETEALERRLAALASPSRAMLPFVSALLIYLREGIEAALLVGALLAAVRRLGQPTAGRFVHAGWLAALPAGVATWWAFERLLSVGFAERELMEGLTALLAAAVLFWVSFWLISKAESRRWMEYLRRGVAESLGRGNLAVLASMSFLAVYREAAETVLFTQVLLQEAPGDARQVWAGAAAGLAATVVFAALMRRAVLSLPVGPFFTVSGILLSLLAVSFAGAGLYSLVAAGYLPARPVAFPAIPWLGVHPDLNGLLVQAAILLTIVGTGLGALWRSSRTMNADRASS
jgi:high-affinity iron transporter